jgi:alanyl-tRNA synthetase
MVDSGAWLKRAIAAFGGRGGGRPEAAQGGLAAAPAQILDFARDTLGEA